MRGIDEKMTREKFMCELEKKLKRFPKEDVADALEFYNEYLEDAGIGMKDEVPQEMESVDKVASQIIAELVDKVSSDKPTSVKKGLSGVTIALLSIFAAPIALPLLICVAALIFAVVILIASLLLTGLCISAGALVSGIVFTVSSLLTVAGTGTGIFFSLGIGLIFTGIGILGFMGMIPLIEWSCFGVTNLFKNIAGKIKKRA